MEKSVKLIQSLFDEIAKTDVYENGFSSDKDAISHIFSLTSKLTKSDILIQLTVIDSLYSTQMSKRYYALDELAEVLYELSRQGNLKQMFLDFLKDKKTDRFTVKDGKRKETQLFNEKYGVDKQGNDSGVAISLISKYAYFLTGYDFPIYDSIAKEIYPKLWKYCFGTTPMPTYQLSQNYHGGDYGDKSIVCFVDAIDKLIEKLGQTKNPQKYNHLDRILWFTGKICRGNMSLVVNREEYCELAKRFSTTKIKHTKTNKEVSSVEFNFNIDNVDVDEQNLPFLKNNKVLKQFFLLAKVFGHIKDN